MSVWRSVDSAAAARASSSCPRSSRARDSISRRPTNGDHSKSGGSFHGNSCATSLERGASGSLRGLRGWLAGGFFLSGARKKRELLTQRAPSLASSCAALLGSRDKPAANIIGMQYFNQLLPSRAPSSKVYVTRRVTSPPASLAFPTGLQQRQRRRKNLATKKTEAPEEFRAGPQPLKGGWQFLAFGLQHSELACGSQLRATAAAYRGKRLTWPTISAIQFCSGQQQQQPEYGNYSPSYLFFVRREEKREWLASSMSTGVRV